MSESEIKVVAMGSVVKNKRGDGEGTVFQRRDGRWTGRIPIAFNQDGKRIYKTVYGFTQAEVIEKLGQLKNGKGITSKRELIIQLRKKITELESVIESLVLCNYVEIKEQKP
jgi:hypothetical protein